MTNITLAKIHNLRKNIQNLSGMKRKLFASNNKRYFKMELVYLAIIPHNIRYIKIKICLKENMTVSEKGKITKT